jgi:hypothetical protein
MSGVMRAARQAGGDQVNRADRGSWRWSTKSACNEGGEFEAGGLPRCAVFIITDNAADCGKFELMIQLTSG